MASKNAIARPGGGGATKKRTITKVRSGKRTGSGTIKLTTMQHRKSGDRVLVITHDLGYSSANCCPHCHKGAFSWHEDTDSGKPLKPKAGDCGQCGRCGGWWTMKGGQFLKYRPTAQERRRVDAYRARVER